MLDILYQDDNIIAVNKPAGMLVHRSWLDKHETVFVMQTLRDQIGQHVFPIHRLDRPTSGVLLFALNSETANLLCQQFTQNQVHKTYLAVVRGYVEGESEIDYALKPKWDKIADKFSQQDKEAQSAQTGYCALQKAEMPYGVKRYATSRYTLLRLMPKTGRKHQIRRHLKHIFHPILGDTQYGDLHQNRAFKENIGVERLMLHAETLSFTHPYTNAQITLRAPLDENWKTVLDQLQWTMP
ncbi:tRNA pseudouridine(65) synthase TruC [Actinobacillus delphinicola]|uniref:tRNA pseudouridine(65) synthase TruC n=1 Tax=Actinobacillus delphinicola TaxID=51161 RepID=UPI002442BABF|nr:tRNA pseudouridine(65) synthase TruC [Actinobacillus delphinicola]MDG6896781.1 tRNA pseudouridine(65) synthase TruC [Actinobacillus delphinicola]